MKTQHPSRGIPSPAVYALTIAAFAITVTGCQKDFSASGGSSPVVASVQAADTIPAKSVAALTQTVPFPQATAPGCEFAPDYGETVIQPQPTSGNDYIVAPVNNKNVDGLYLAWPGGLVIDAHTGSINVTQSETGAKYAVGFIRSGSSDTCMSYITLGGADYIDSVYSAAHSAKTAAPHFDANVGGASPCSSPDGCKFDYNHVAKKQGVYVDGKNGAIDIKNTLQHSIFAVLPIDGMYFYTTIQYKANSSNNAAQSIQVKLIYYNYRSSIPASLIQTINDRAESINTGTLGSGVSRPPIIIITRNQ